jgi:hypothetical protein
MVPARFQLEPYNRGASDSDLLDDLRGVARLLGKSYVTKSEYEQRGRFSPATVQNRFGSWCKAHDVAGLHRIRNYHTTAEDCLASLRRVAQSLGKPTITTAEYLQSGGFSLRILTRHFGSWKAAIERAGFCVSPLYHERASRDELFQNIERLWESLGRQPKTADFEEPASQFSCATYKRHFGSLRKALVAFVESFETAKGAADPVQKEGQPTVPPSSATKRHKTSRTISWRMRFLVMRRDSFKCRICGRSPATHPGTVMVVDHIMSWDSGGETVMENLQALCEPCNSGKSNLSMKQS